jgi:hypothetical protein
MESGFPGLLLPETPDRQILFSVPGILVADLVPSASLSRKGLIMKRFVLRDGVPGRGPTERLDAVGGIGGVEPCGNPGRQATAMSSSSIFR